MELKNAQGTLEQLKEILGCFVPDGEAHSFEPIQSGYINDTFLVLKGIEPLYILQRVNHGVFKDVDGLMGNIAKATTKLRAADYQSITIFPTRQGTTHASLPSGHWRLMEYIPGSTSFDTTTDLHIAQEAGRIIGKFHLLMQGEDPDLYCDTLPQFHDLELRYAQYQQGLKDTTPERMTMAERGLLKVDAIYAHLQQSPPKNVPVRVCHNDTKLNNILFSKDTGKALCLIDLDTLMRGYFQYDFGDAVRIIANTAPEDEKNLQLISFDEGRFTAFVTGLATHVPFLSPQEISALPYGTILMPFLHGLRALTDFLNFDAYYKIAYPTQNLDRALSLLQFAEKALAAEAFMSASVKEHLTPKN
jgi:Ser/Thr protein kinase RdoA (MazF antagonist)